ncbi:MAG: DUF928 domain-containing protein, partial [Cyanobacteria bacterium P01_F01_bin.143]
IFVSTSVKAIPEQISDQISQNSSQKNTNFRSTFKPPKQNKPKFTIGGSTRGNTCDRNQKENNEITALVPESDQSLTMQQHPSFFVYVSPMNGEKSAILVVKDETEDYYYSQQLMIPAAGGVIKMTLNEDAPPLEVGQSYDWFLRIQCNTTLQPEDPQISATITRVEGNIPSMTPEESVLFFTNSQIWYDSLNSAFELSKSGQDLYWSQLLSDIEMQRFVVQ